MSLTGKTLSGSYKDILQVDNSNNGITANGKDVKDGEGTTSALSLGSDRVMIQPQATDSTRAVRVMTQSGSEVMAIETSTSLVKVNGTSVNTQYATFAVNSTELAGASAGRHFAIPFQNSTYADVSNPPMFGSGIDPETSFTTAESNGYRASDIVPMMWYLCDDISIDAVKHIEGADTATGDTTRLHLYSYDFTSGATNCLTNGTLLARSANTTNAGSEQPYFQNWAIDSAAVTSGKVIIATMDADSVNSDYSAIITVKYHLT
tara:strand:- start:5417 stop:6205 length:789 start_codon:yes stop_codon:yes gene_type:complete